MTSPRRDHLHDPPSARNEHRPAEGYGSKGRFVERQVHGAIIFMIRRRQETSTGLRKANGSKGRVVERQVHGAIICKIRRRQETSGGLRKAEGSEDESLNDKSTARSS